MKVSWADVNNTETPGRFPLLGGTVTVEQQNIDIWKSKPTARFTVIPFTAIADGVERHVLGGLTMYRMRTFSAAAKAKGK